MSIILNAIDCESSVRGTGTLGCTTDVNYVILYAIIEKGVEFDLATDTIDQDFIDGLVQSGKIVFLPEHVNTTSETESTVYETTPTGNKIFIRNGIYEFMASYTNGYCFANSLSSLESKSWDLFMVDINGDGVTRLWGQETSNGKFKGFGLETFKVENTTLNDGSVATKTPLRLALSTSGTSAFQKRKAYIVSNDEVDFANIDGVNETTINAISLLATNFIVSVNLFCSSSVAITSLSDANNWVVKDVAGVVQTITITAINGEYVIGGLSAGIYTVSLYDNTLDFTTIAVGGVYYSSDTLNVVLT